MGLGMVRSRRILLRWGGGKGGRGEERINIAVTVVEVFLLLTFLFLNFDIFFFSFCSPHSSLLFIIYVCGWLVYPRQREQSMTCDDQDIR